MNVDHEVKLLVEEIHRLGSKNQTCNTLGSIWKIVRARDVFSNNWDNGPQSFKIISYADGKLSVKFGVLFQDDKCANLFEALVGTLKAAKRRKIITYSGELLLQGVHDDVDIILLQD